MYLNIVAERFCLLVLIHEVLDTRGFLNSAHPPDSKIYAKAFNAKDLSACSPLETF